jgi:hypothetical protein
VDTSSEGVIEHRWEAERELEEAIRAAPRNNRLKLRLARMLRRTCRRPRQLSAVCAHPFSIANIELTNRCPMRCVMCPRTHRMGRPQGYMNFDVFGVGSG